MQQLGSSSKHAELRSEQLLADLASLPKITERSSLQEIYDASCTCLDEEVRICRGDAKYLKFETFFDTLAPLLEDELTRLEVWASEIKVTLEQLTEDVTESAKDGRGDDPLRLVNSNLREIYEYVSSIKILLRRIFERYFKPCTIVRSSY